ncbi:hypothetical protein C1645_814295 [Glomus cerebriforme]|uniref:Uncharacterized protein n=1 Tax=Glomus cerebriforme TaxID=658196 RepID=A0A397TG56_9GLOM|nr:hypothetical protein C1645_814295 [Glomus cerebriforme]
MPYKFTRGARDAIHIRGLRRSKRVIDRSCEIYAREEEEEGVLNSSHQSTSTTSQPSSTQQSSSQQSAILLIITDPEIIMNRPYTPITSPTPIEKQ